MKKEKNEYVCVECGFKIFKWLGKCPDCSSWNTFQVFNELNFNKNSSNPSMVYSLDQIEVKNNHYFSTGLNEFDIVLGGGIYKGAFVLLAGEPGVGKSTLIMQVLNKMLEESNTRVLYVTGEETLEQVATRAKRLDITSNKIMLSTDNAISSIKEMVKKYKPTLLIVDSIQTISLDATIAANPSISQIKEVTYELMNFIKSEGLTSVVIGHITKDGSIAGPKLLEHMVDVVLYFESGEYEMTRYLRCEKNRFGESSTLGVFNFTKSGLESFYDKHQYKLFNTKAYVGRVLSCVRDSNRAYLLEVQSIISEGFETKRVLCGVEYSRFLILLSITEKIFKISFKNYQIYMNIVGNTKLCGKDADLAIIMSILSSYYNRVIPANFAFHGEVDLMGRVRTTSLTSNLLSSVRRFGVSRLYHNSEVNDKFSFLINECDSLLDLINLEIK